MRLVIILLSLLLTYGAESCTGMAAASTCTKTFDVRSYHAVGDGIANDTVPLQSAINAAKASGCGVVLGHPTDTYLVYMAGTKYFSNASYGPYKYSLAIPSNVTLNLQGGTLKLADNQNSSIIVNANLQTGGDYNISIINSILDGNGANQTDDPGLDTGAIIMYGVTNLQIQNVATNNVRMAGIIIDNIKRSNFDKLSCNMSYGDCFEFGAGAGPAGSSFANWTVRYSTIGTVNATNCLGTGEPNIRPGNSFVGTVVYVHIASITATNCAAGIKIQNTSYNVIVDNAFTYGGVNGTNNSGFKVQGSPADENGYKVNLVPRKIFVGHVYSEGQYGTGLYIQDAVSTTINSYVGKNNGKGGVYADAWVSGTNTKINQISVENAGIGGVEVRDDIYNYRLGSVSVSNAVLFGMDVEGGVGVINSLQVTSNQTPPMQYGLAVLAGAQGAVLNLQLAGASYNLDNNSSKFHTPTCCY